MGLVVGPYGSFLARAGVAVIVKPQRLLRDTGWGESLAVSLAICFWTHLRVPTLRD